MSIMKIAAIARNPKNSPAMYEKDRAILCSVTRIMSSNGHNVQLLTEEEYADECSRFDIIINMSRTPSTLEKLCKAQAAGCIVTNTPQAVHNCSRRRFTECLKKENIPQPQSTIHNVDEAPPCEGYPLWIKKADGWSEHPSDVCYASNSEEATAALANFKSRGINEVIICRHIEGDIIKFYGIGQKFFRVCRPNPDDTKFGLEKINGTPHHYPIDSEELHAMALAAARSIGVEIFGGDAIITPESKIYIIDLNDFPSFSAVRDEAAQAIYDLINSKIKKQ